MSSSTRCTNIFFFIQAFLLLPISLIKQWCSQSTHEQLNPHTVTPAQNEWLLSYTLTFPYPDQDWLYSLSFVPLRLEFLKFKLSGPAELNCRATRYFMKSPIPFFATVTAQPHEVCYQHFFHHKSKMQPCNSYCEKNNHNHNTHISI